MQVEVQDEALVQTLEVNNTGRTPMRITTAMHTYFRVGDISQARVGAEPSRFGRSGEIAMQ